MAAKPAKLPSLDLGRFYAALLVVCFHASFTVINFGEHAPFDLLFRGGHAGVEYFFVLSGFIIYFTHRRDFSVPSRLGPFFRKRATRILPMLWLTLVVWGGLRALLPGQTTLERSTPADFVLDLFLLPHAGPLTLGVAWTLQRELVFYLLFSLAIVNRRLGLGVLAMWQVAILVSTALQMSWGPWGSALFDVDNIGFGLGLLIAATIERISVPRPRLVALFGIVLYLALMIVEWRIGGPVAANVRPLGRWTTPLGYSLASGICVLGLVHMDLSRPRAENRLVAILGGTSYVLYLTHGPVGSVLVRLLRHARLGPELLFIALVIGPILVAVLLFSFVERPILRALRPKPPRRPELPTDPARSPEILTTP
jgi:exopolysaccharide production protein ExoZ